MEKNVNPKNAKIPAKRNKHVGAAIGRPRGVVYGFALDFGEFAGFSARTSDARPYVVWV